MARTYGFDHFTSHPVAPAGAKPGPKPIEAPPSRDEPIQYRTAFAETQQHYHEKLEEAASRGGRDRAAEPWLTARDEIRRLTRQWVATGKAIGRLPAHIGRSALKRMLKSQK